MCEIWFWKSKKDFEDLKLILVLIKIDFSFGIDFILPLKLEFKGKKLIRYEIINSSYSLKGIINYKL
jgi:hypothetical protein